jgi:tetratricopeptide (TPR) repeat protein
MNRDPDVFISYAHPDDQSPQGKKGIISRLEDHLRVLGRQKCGRPLDIFRDTGLASGVQWEKELFDKLRASWIFLPVFSPSWSNSQFCRREWDEYWDVIKEELRVENRTRIVPVSFELGAEQIGRLLPGQRSLQIVHCFRSGMTKTEFGKAADKLVEEVAALLGTRASRGSAEVDSLASAGSAGVSQARNSGPAAPQEPLFDAVPFYFQNRQFEQAKIRSFLSHPSLRLLRVVGASGMGKTTLVYRVLNALDPKTALHVITLNAAQPDGVSITYLVAELSKLANSRGLSAPKQDRGTSIEQRLLDLLSLFLRQRIVVFIDEFQSLVDNATRRTAPDVAALISLVLRQNKSPLKLILATIVEPTDLASIVPALQEWLFVDSLQSPWGENLLRERDADGKVGLKTESPDLLKLACERLGWSPRELELLYWELINHPSTTLNDLLENPALLHGNAAEFFINKVFNGFDPETRKVAEALAIYGRPVPPDAIAWLLEPYRVGTDPVGSLNHLCDVRLARRRGSLYYLQPLERNYILSQIPAKQGSFGGGPVSFSCDVLFKRAADHYAKLRNTPGREPAPDAGELLTEVDEFELRCAGGDYERAAQVLLGVRFQELLVRGRYGRIAQLHEQLLGKVQDPVLRMHSLVRLGVAYYRTGKFSGAVNIFQMALAAYKAAFPPGQPASEAEPGPVDRSERHEATISGNLANCYAALGRTRPAIRMYSEALEIANRLSDEGSRATYLQCLGNRYADLGQRDAAYDYYQQALAIYDAMLASSKEDLGGHVALMELQEERAILLGNIASLRIDDGKWSEAMKTAQAALETGRELASALLQSSSNCYLAIANVFVGNLEIARTFIDQARKFEVPQLDHRVFALFGLIALRQGDKVAARQAFSRAVEYGRALMALDEFNYEAQESICLSEYGLGQCGVPDRLLPVREAYRAARRMNRDSGVVARFESLLKVLNAETGSATADWLDKL